MLLKQIPVLLALAMSMLVLATTACTALPQARSTPTPALEVHFEPLERAPDVPELPFADNPDPNQCGIPVPWGTDEPAWVTGYYQGELVQPTVFLYDSHLRLSIAGAVPSGTEVQVILYQQNPSLDYYFVKSVDSETPQEGWVPAPFLSFETVN
jgi:hypothetical protein